MEGLVAQFEHWGDKVLHARLFAIAVNVGAFLLIGISVAQWGWGYYLRSVAITSGAVLATAPAPAPQASDLDRLISIELFGHARTASENTDTLPVSSLNIILKGVVVAGGESLALISADGSEQLPYSIGQEISHGAILDAVYADHIIILRQGVRESVMLEENSPAAVSLRPVTMTPSFRPGTRSITQIKPNQYQVNRSFIRKQMQSPSLLTQALILPDSSGGFKMRAVSSDSIYAKAGLQSGDIIKRVNGIPINTVDEAMKLYRKLGGINRISSVNLELERNGRKHRIQYRVR